MTINQEMYIKKLIKWFDMNNAKINDASVATATLLDMDELGSIVDEKLYRVIKDFLLYLTTSRLDIVFSIGFVTSFNQIPIGLFSWIWQ